MAVGIAGDNPVLDAWQSENLMAIELRVISQLMQNLMGNGTAAFDNLTNLRNDVAFELGVQPPVVPGN